jgi:hypothetical protein
MDSYLSIIQKQSDTENNFDEKVKYLTTDNS